MKLIKFNLTENELVTLQQILITTRRGKIRAYSQYGWPRLTDEIDLITRLIITLNNPEQKLDESEALDRDILSQGESIKTVDVATLQLPDLIKRRRSIQRALSRAQTGATKAPTTTKLEFWKTELQAVVVAIYTHYQQAKAKSK